MGMRMRNLVMRNMVDGNENEECGVCNENVEYGGWV